MPRSILSVFFGILHWLFSPIVVAVRAIDELMAIAWPPPTVARELLDLSTATEAAFSGRQRSRAVAFEDRRVQREPLALAAGCGLCIAA